MYDILEESIFSIIIALAPDKFPIKDSPTDNSAIVVELLVIVVKLIFGADGSELPSDSKIA